MKDYDYYFSTPMPSAGILKELHPTVSPPPNSIHELFNEIYQHPKMPIRAIYSKINNEYLRRDIYISIKRLWYWFNENKQQYPNGADSITASMLRKATSVVVSFAKANRIPINQYYPTPLYFAQNYTDRLLDVITTEETKKEKLIYGGEMLEDYEIKEIESTDYCCNAKDYNYTLFYFPLSLG